jgi:hypothetical protein
MLKFPYGLRNFYDLILERVFITGISPIVLADMSSGYNVGEHIYLLREFNELCGFSETEIVQVSTQIAKTGDFPPEQIQQALFLMRTFYDGYRFSERAKDLVYKSDFSALFLEILAARRVNVSGLYFYN